MCACVSVCLWVYVCVFVYILTHKCIYEQDRMQYPINIHFSPGVLKCSCPQETELVKHKLKNCSLKFNCKLVAKYPQTATLLTTELSASIIVNPLDSTGPQP